MVDGHIVQAAADFARDLKPRTRYLLALWGFFFLFVAFGIHGSSTGIAAKWWAPEKPYTGFLFGHPREPAAVDAGGLQELFMASARGIRWDELLVQTPLALSQLSHRPRFPVINTNIGNGQNMLVNPHAPVWHIATLSRPATWGYFFLGAQRGLAWYWWFRVVSCFTVLYLLLEIILKGHRGLAAFGSFWYCASAYVVCWSLWPTQLVFFGALGCVAGYHLLATSKHFVQIVSAALLGLSIPGFVMFLYPPWQVPVGYLFLFVFVGLFIRDGLYHSFKLRSKYRMLCLIGALALASGLTLSFLFTCLPDLKVMSNTIYPGKRVSVGGDYSFAMLFKGLYNLATIRSVEPKIGDESEASSYYYLFPAVFVGILLSRRLRTKLGLMGWLLIAYLAAILVFLLAGVPERVARATLLSYVPPYRADIAVGLASIILCVYALALIKDVKTEAGDGWSRLVPAMTALAVAALFFLHGVALMKATEAFPPANALVLVSLLGGILSYCLLAGRAAIFCGALAVIAVATTALFNPLATNLDHIYKSELAQQIVRFNNQSVERPLWLSYGGVYPGMLITALGGRSLTGVQWPPQLSLWRSLAPNAPGYERAYNRYAEVSLEYRENPNWVSFRNPNQGVLIVGLDPRYPALKSLGARYV